MAVRKFFLCIGQSNADATATFADYLGSHPELNFVASANYNIGPYQQQFTLPGSWAGWENASGAGYTATVSLAGMALEPVKFLTPYNPLPSGYAAYPGNARVVASGSTTTSIKTDVKYATSAVGMTIVRKLTNTTHTVTATTTTAGYGVLTLSGSTPFTTSPVDGEEIQIQIKARVAVTPGGTTVSTHVTWGFSFGPSGAQRASLVGLELRYLGPAHPGMIGDRKKITAVSAGGDTITFDSAWQSDPHLNDLFEIVPPQVGGVDVPIHKWAYWLPWSPWEGLATGGLYQPAPKRNPYPYGFNYPQHYSTFNYYWQPFDGPTSLYAGTPRASLAIGLGAKLAQYLGQDAYCILSGIGSSMLAISENDSATHNGYGWYDSTAQNNWSPAQPYNAYARILDSLDAAKTAAQAQGDTLQCVGVFFIQGEHDGLSASTYNAYKDNLTTFKSVLRQAIVTKGLAAVTANQIPWVQPFIVPTWTGAVAVNQAIADVAKADTYMATFSTEGFLLDDTVHYSGYGLQSMEAALMSGFIAAQAGNGGWSDAVTVETGSASSTGDSYVSEAFVEDYLWSIGGATAWTNASPKQRNAAMRRATMWIDNNYGTRFVGLSSSSTQALEWPRSFAYDRDGYPITGIPTALKKATAEVARRWLEDATQLDPDIAAGSNVTQDTVTVGPITISKTYAGGKDAEKRFKVVDRLFQVAGLIDSGGWAKR